MPAVIAATRLRDLLRKPEYLWRPKQAVLRLWRGLARPPDTAVVELPWRVALEVRPRDVIGRAIWTSGVYDLPVSEALWRLADPGETAVDAGANIGYLTSLLARRVGPRGRVFAFEPHPQVYLDLEENAARWGTGADVGHVQLARVALGETAGTAMLEEGVEFATNRGTAHLTTEAAPPAGAPTRWAVEVTTLDAALQGVEPSIIKLDCEGHELAVLRGAGRLLASRQLRDIVFEEHGETERPAGAHLRQAGFAVFRLDKTLIGPVLVPFGAAAPAGAFLPTSYLATRDEPRARGRFAARGWQVLR